MPSRTRLLFVDPAVAPDVGAVHQGLQALHNLHAWAERSTGCKIARPPGNLAERARFYWERVPAALRKKAQLYIIRERRDTPWRFSDANPWRRGLRPVAESRVKMDWGLSNKTYISAKAAKITGLSLGQPSAPASEPDSLYHVPKRKKPTPAPPQQPKERLKVGIWS